MKSSNNPDLSQLSLTELFRVEAESQTRELTAGLLELERGNASASLLESLMRAAHSLKGAARIVNLTTAGQLAHAMEDCFVAAQQGRLKIQRAHVDTLLRGVDLLNQLARCETTKLAAWEETRAEAINSFLVAAQEIRAGQPPKSPLATRSLEETIEPPPTAAAVPLAEEPPATTSSPGVALEPGDRVIRLDADNLNQLLGLAGESLVESHWLRPFSDSMQRLKRMQSELDTAIDQLRQSLDPGSLTERTNSQLAAVALKSGAMQKFFNERIEELGSFERRSAHLANRLYLEVLRTRMRPFGEGVDRFPRMVRDLAHSLGKLARLEIVGEHTPVDRDILEKLEAPLAQLLRNAVDHGCELPAARTAAGKPAEAVVLLEARHNAGMLVVTVADDGAGLEPNRLRQALLGRQLATPAALEKLSEPELLQFLFLPGFTMKRDVTEISGRGVGLDVVQNMVKAVRGSVRVATQPGRGMRFQLQLPLTLSVLRTLLVEIGGEPYALPLAQIGQAVRLARDRVETLEGRPHFLSGDQPVGLVSAAQVLGCAAPPTNGAALSVVVLGDRHERVGLVVDRFIGERELVVQPLDPRLGQVPDISAAALMEDGSPVLIVDVDGLLRSALKFSASGGLAAELGTRSAERGTRRRKRILAVDDSRIVRELERKLLLSRGYLADVAEDGLEGWNAVRSGVYDLVITDVDMPRMDGIQLATLIKQEFKSVPVMIVSYKDRPEDRLRGLNAGADYYLTKGDFQDEALVEAVADLIGEADA